MPTLDDLQTEMTRDPAHWYVCFMDFVDAFRRAPSVDLLQQPSASFDTQWSPLLAATAETLCREAQLVAPDWVESVPACPIPWFVSGVENLKAIALAESPLPFRRRKIFVLANFLDRA